MECNGYFLGKWGSKPLELGIVGRVSLAQSQSRNSETFGKFYVIFIRPGNMDFSLSIEWFSFSAQNLWDKVNKNWTCDDAGHFVVNNEVPQRGFCLVNRTQKYQKISSNYVKFFLGHFNVWWCLVLTFQNDGKPFGIPSTFRQTAFKKNTTLGVGFTCCGKSRTINHTPRFPNDFTLCEYRKETEWIIRAILIIMFSSPSSCFFVDDWL